MPSASEWRVAYAKQAKADLQARQRLLEHPKIPECQQLHFLQMACEKVCKSYLCGLGSDPQSLQGSHAYIARVLPIVARQRFVFQSRREKQDHSWILAAIRKLARKIELLAPAVLEGGAVPANCEYPWIGPDGRLRIPAEHNFQIDLLHEPGGRHLVKALYAIVEELIEEPPG